MARNLNENIPNCFNRVLAESIDISGMTWDDFENDRISENDDDAIFDWDISAPYDNPIDFFVELYNYDGPSAGTDGREENPPTQDEIGLPYGEEAEELYFDYIAKEFADLNGLDVEDVKNNEDLKEYLLATVYDDWQYPKLDDNRKEAEHQWKDIIIDYYQEPDNDHPDYDYYY